MGVGLAPKLFPEVYFVLPTHFIHLIDQGKKMSLLIKEYKRVLNKSKAIYIYLRCPYYSRTEYKSALNKSKTIYLRCPYYSRTVVTWHSYRAWLICDDYLLLHFLLELMLLFLQLPF